MSFCPGSCSNYNLTNGSAGTDVTVDYVECEGGTTISILVSASTSYNFCACSGSTPTIVPSGVEFVDLSNVGPCFIETPTPTPTITVTPTITPSVSSTNIIILTPTSTPTITSTVTITPSISSSAIIPLTPTATPTSSPFPLNSATPSNTPTKTPASSPVYIEQNECDVFTIFPLGVFCSTQNPTTSNSLDGNILLIVTGGTPPYNFYWSNGNRTNTLNNVGVGNYPVSVVDYYGDFTAVTTCSLFGPTPTPTPTATITKTPTPSPITTDLCLYIVGNNVITTIRQFIFSGYLNNKPKWLYDGGVNEIYWNLNTNRWEISGLNVLNGILVSNTKSNIPDNGWYIAGGTSNANISVIRGNCGNVPLGINIQKTNTTCNDINTCNGVINIDAFGGNSPYAYSIDGGKSYQQASFFTNLCKGSYAVSVLDSSGATINQITSLSYDNTGTTYTVSFRIIDEKIYNPEIKEVNWILEVKPKLTIGATIQLDIVENSINKIFQPGTGTANLTNVIYKNSTILNPFNTNTTNVESIRPNCSPYKIIENTNAKSYSVTINNSDVVSGTTTSQLKITDNKTADNGCSTLVTQDTFIGISNIKYSACSCCNVIWDETLLKIQKHELSGLDIQLPPVGIKYPFVVRVGNSVSEALTNPRILVFINSPFFTTNVSVYTVDNNILIGYKYINVDGTIYNLNSSNGVVGTIV